MRFHRPRLPALLVLASVLAGCTARPYVVADPAYSVERSRSAILVVPTSRDRSLIPAAQQTARLLAGELAAHWFNVLDLDLVLQASPGLESVLQRLAQQTMAAELLDRVAADLLLERHRVGQLLVVDLFQYEQYWGRQTKLTRVGAAARLVTLSEGRTLWQGLYSPELSGSPGHAFDAATRRVAREVVRAMTHGLPNFRDTPFAEWPVLEYLSPN